jgi:hypothetical protein
MFVKRKLPSRNKNLDTNNGKLSRPTPYSMGILMVYRGKVHLHVPMRRPVTVHNSIRCIKWPNRHNPDAKLWHLSHPDTSAHDHHCRRECSYSIWKKYRVYVRARRLGSTQKFGERCSRSRFYYIETRSCLGALRDSAANYSSGYTGAGKDSIEAGR